MIIYLDRRALEVADGTTVAAALALAGDDTARTSCTARRARLFAGWACATSAG